MPPQYKFVEVSPVTGEALEAAVNEWVARGWQLEGIRFVVPEHSKRPELAFVSFTASMASASPGPPEIAPGPPAPPLGPAEPSARVITAAHGDEVE
jgi:hypothetical protein